MKKPLAAALLTAAAVATLAVPAGAAVPQHSPADQTLPCNDGSGKSAQVWVNHYYAAKNPCSQWLAIWHKNWDESDSKAQVVNVAPGSHFHWRGNLASLDVIVQLSGNEQCGEDVSLTITRNSHGKPQPSSCSA